MYYGPNKDLKSRHNKFIRYYYRDALNHLNILTDFESIFNFFSNVGNLATIQILLCHSGAFYYMVYVHVHLHINFARLENDKIIEKNLSSL